MSKSTVTNPMVDGDNYTEMSDDGEDEVIKDVSVTETWLGAPEYVHVMTTERKSIGSRSSLSKRYFILQISFHFIVS